MYFITTKRMLEVCFSAHPNIQYRTLKSHPTIDKEPKKITHPEKPRCVIGALEETRTPDLLIRSQTLYPAELPAHMRLIINRK